MIKFLIALMVIPAAGMADESGGSCIQITREARPPWMKQCNEYTDAEGCRADRCFWSAAETTETTNRSEVGENAQSSETENAEPSSCEAVITFQDNGDFSMVSADYPLQHRGHNAVSGNDDDGLVGFMAFNSMVKNTPHTVTNQERSMLEAAARRAKAYWGNNTNLSLTELSATDAIAHVIENRAQAETAINDLGYDGAYQVDQMIEYLAAVNIMEKMASKDKLEQGDVNLMQVMLADRGNKHQYLFENRNNYQPLCGAATVRCCNYASENVLSQTLCGHAAEVESNASENWTLTDAYKCNVTLGEGSGAPVLQSRSLGAARAN